MAAHIVNNHIIMAFYIDCIHTDICEQSVITRWLSAIQMVIIQIQSHSPQNMQTYMKNVEEKKRKVYLSKKPIAKLRPHQMTGASQRASRAVTRARQNSNKQSSAYLSLFFWDGLILFVRLYAKKQCCFFTTKTLFLSAIYSITDTNNNSPEEMKRKQRNNDPNYNVIVSLD